MANIAAFDWPEKWPELFSLLIEALHSNNKNVIHGAMRVFAGMSLLSYVININFRKMILTT